MAIFKIEQFPSEKFIQIHSNSFSLKLLILTLELKYNLKCKNTIHNTRQLKDLKY